MELMSFKSSRAQARVNLDVSVPRVKVSRRLQETLVADLDLSIEPGMYW